MDQEVLYLGAQARFAEAAARMGVTPDIFQLLADVSSNTAYDLFGYPSEWTGIYSLYDHFKHAAIVQVDPMWLLTGTTNHSLVSPHDLIAKVDVNAAQGFNDNAFSRLRSCSVSEALSAAIVANPVVLGCLPLSCTYFLSEAADVYSPSVVAWFAQKRPPL